MSAGNVKIFPRRKSIGTYCGSDKLVQRYMLKPSSREPISINVDMIRPYFGLPQRLAAAHLGLSLTALKGVCRKLGIPKWAQARATSVGGPPAHVDSSEISGTFSIGSFSSSDHPSLSPGAGTKLEIDINLNAAPTFDASDLKLASCKTRPTSSFETGEVGEKLHELFELDVLEDCLTLPNDDPMDRNTDVRNEQLEDSVNGEMNRVHDFVMQHNAVDSMVVDAIIDHHTHIARIASDRHSLQEAFHCLRGKGHPQGDCAQQLSLALSQSGDDLSYLVPFSSQNNEDYHEFLQMSRAVCL